MEIQKGKERRMGLFGVIFYILIIVIFINAKKAAGSGSDHRRGTTRTNLQGNYSGQKNYTSKQTTALPNVPKQGKSALPNVPSKGQKTIPNVPVKKKNERTFMESHKEETMQPKIRTNNLWGEDEHAKQRIVALRLMEGDPVPDGYVKIRCPYCAADNLVTKHSKQYHSCYFCRVPID